MVISGGSSRAYYRCETYSRRGRCTNKRSVPEAVVRANLLDELRRRLTSPDAVAYARKRIAERLGDFSRDRNREQREHRARLEKTERQIEKLASNDHVDVGGHSPYAASDRGDAPDDHPWSAGLVQGSGESLERGLEPMLTATARRPGHGSGSSPSDVERPRQRVRS